MINTEAGAWPAPHLLGRLWIELALTDKPPSGPFFNCQNIRSWLPRWLAFRLPSAIERIRRVDAPCSSSAEILQWEPANLADQWPLDAGDISSTWRNNRFGWSTIGHWFSLLFFRVGLRLALVLSCSACKAFSFSPVGTSMVGSPSR